MTMTGQTSKALVRTFVWFAGLGAILFVAAGDGTWPAAWLCLAENLLLSCAVVLWLARHDPALLEERMAMRWHRDQAGWDRAFLASGLVVFLAWFVLIGFDARRFGWSHVPDGLRIVGAAAIAACMALVWRVFRVNSFAVPQVRTQAHRKQVAIHTGPYAYVRHPMYSAALLYFLGLPLMLGSWFGLAAGLALSVGLGARAIGEERLLARDLDGYATYAAQVRWRLVPGVW